MMITSIEQAFTCSKDPDVRHKAIRYLVSSYLSHFRDTDIEKLTMRLQTTEERLLKLQSHLPSSVDELCNSDYVYLFAAKQAPFINEMLESGVIKLNLSEL